MRYELFVSMLEVYNEKIMDLLVENSNQPAKKFQISDFSDFMVSLHHGSRALLNIKVQPRDLQICRWIAICCLREFAICRWIAI